MDILIDSAIRRVFMYKKHNQIQVNSSDFLSDIFNKNKFYHLFIVTHPGSYVGIRKTALLTYLQNFSPNIRVYTLDIMNFFLKSYDRVMIVVGKHVWISTREEEDVIPMSYFIPHINKYQNPHINTCTNSDVIKNLLNVSLIDISLFTLWRNKKKIFTYSKVPLLRYHDKYNKMMLKLKI